LGHLVVDDATDTGEEQLEPGDMVLLYTDGVVEARSPGGEFFGVERLSELVQIQLAGGLDAPETMRRVVRELLMHNDNSLSDDATLLMLEWRRPTAG
jgi:serine phosphatase RsbU (regulator of sigma subunit)